MYRGCRLVLLLSLTACGLEEATVRTGPANRKPGYFDMKSLLDAQVAALNRQQPVVEKQVRLRDGQQETTRVAKTDWGKELQIFYQADINKPALRGAYDVQQPRQSAEPQTVYQANGQSETTVQQLLIEGDTAHPQVIAATIQQNNPLFYAEKKLRLSLRNGALTEYEVQGVQKLILFDTVRYSVRTRVVQQ